MNNYSNGIKYHQLYLKFSGESQVEKQRANTQLGKTYYEYARHVADDVRESKTKVTL